MPFIALRKFPYVAHFLSVFIMTRYWILSDVFSVSIEMILWGFFFLYSINVAYNIDFSYVKPFSWDKSHLGIVYNRFNTLLDSVHLYFVEKCCIYIHKRYWSVIFFAYDVLVWLWYYSNSDLIEWVRKCFSTSIFWKSLRRIDVHSSLNVCCNAPVKPSGPRLYLIERFLLPVQTLYLL